MGGGVGGGVATAGLAFAVALCAKVYVTGESQEVLDTAMEMGALGGLLGGGQQMPPGFDKFTKR